MPTFGGEIEDRRVLLNVTVKLPLPPESNESPDIRGFTGLFDTGATRTMVSQNVIDEVGAPPCGRAYFVSASGNQTLTTTHLLDLSIPVVTDMAPVPQDNDLTEVTVFASGRRNVPVLLLPRPLDGFDVVLGMDLIALFHTTICMGNFMLSN